MHPEALGRHPASAAYQAGPTDGATAGAKAVAGPAVAAGIEAGGKYVLANSVVRRSIERDDTGQITGTIEERVPVKQPEAAQ